MEVQLLLGARLFHSEQPRDVQADVESARSFDRRGRVCPPGRSVPTHVRLYGDRFHPYEDWCVKYFVENEQMNSNRKSVNLLQWGKPIGIKVNVKKGANGLWNYSNKNSIVSTHRLTAHKLVMSNRNKNTPKISYDEWTPAQVNSLPMLRYK